MATATEDASRSAAMLSALASISKVLGKESDFEQFLQDTNWSDSDKLSNKADVARHTSSWIQLMMPVLGKLYDRGYYDAQKTDGEAYRNARRIDKS